MRGNYPEIWNTVLDPDKDKSYFELKTAVKKIIKEVIEEKKHSIKVTHLNKKSTEGYFSKLNELGENYKDSLWRLVDRIYENHRGKDALEIFEKSFSLTTYPIIFALGSYLKVAKILKDCPEVLEYTDEIGDVADKKKEFVDLIEDNP